METAIAIPADVARRLGYYVYVLVNPIDGSIFYVGSAAATDIRVVGFESSAP